MKKTISIKQNFFINSIVNILNIIVPIITLPYLSRTLGPENLGKINFAISYTDYFSKLALLGIPKYALREISQNRDNQLILNKTFSEIILIKIITSLISFLLFFLSIIFIPKLNNEIRIFLPLSFSILFSFLSLEWFYGGFENFKFLTKRAVVLKLSAIILILTLIKKPADYYLYGFIVLFGIVSGNFAHIFFALKKVRFSLININLKKHFKPVIYLSGTFLATGLYMNIDKVMIGFLSSNENVAFYYIPNKLCMILLALLMSLSGVLIPRFSYYIKNKKFDEYKIILKKSINFIFFLSIPSMIGIFLLSEQIISLFASSEFSEAIITLKIMVLIIITTALVNCIGLQILFPFGKDKLYFFSSLIGGIVNIILNFLLIPLYSHNGAAVATVITNLIVFLTIYYFSKKIISFSIFSISILKYILSSFIMGICIIYMSKLEINNLILLPTTIIIAMLCYFSFLLFLKEELITFILFKKVKNSL